jgi:hypothetical protein
LERAVALVYRRAAQASQRERQMARLTCPLPENSAALNSSHRPVHSMNTHLT